MRDLLYLAHRIPFPPDKGDKIRSYHILRHLQENHRIHLGCFFDDAEDERYVGELARICASMNCQPLPLNVKRRRGLAGIARGDSVTAASYQDVSMGRWVTETVTRYNIRQAFIFSSAMAPYVSPYSDTMRIVTDLVDMDSEKWRIYADNSSFAPEILYRREQQKVLELERAAARMSSHVLLVSDAETASCRALLPEFSSRMLAMTNGVDARYFDPALSYPDPYNGCPSAIVFAGAMDYEPNADAVTWFSESIFPKILADFPTAEFWIVGSNPKSSVRRLLRMQNIRITGRVADIRPYLAHAACVIAPMRMARGIQNKVLEGMAMAKPMVMTPAALEGLRAIPGKDLELAYTDTEFATKVIDAISGNITHIGAAARDYVLRSHDWQTNLRVLDNLIDGSDLRRPDSKPTVGAVA